MSNDNRDNPDDHHDPGRDEDATSLLTKFEGAPEDETGDAELKLPGYKVLQQLGSGGMGMVFLARQLEPVDRQVAVKLIQHRIRNPASEVHFLVERQALAQMQHPAIAQIFEAGTNPDGFPYFAMEYVPGEPLLEFCDQHRLDIHARLDLFVRICHGVSHAHQKGIVHRDLKPSNILVSMIDGVPRPKIIDFGIAVAETSARDRRRQNSAGTPVYMSPELFDDSASIDTRADIYSLGIILCELLCDQRPHAGTLFKQTETTLIFQALCERPPASPSDLLLHAGKNTDRIAQQRSTTPGRLARRFKGDLDAITLKAVAAKREHRYASALELADDIGNHLQCKPVRAMGDGRGYRLRRFMARNAWGVAATAVIIVALATGMAFALAGLNQARTQQQIAEARTQELERMVAFQQSMLGDLDPRQLGEGFVERLRDQYAQSFDYTASDETVGAGVQAFETAVGRINPTDLAQDLMDDFMLQRAVAKIRQDFADQPRLQADLYQTVRAVYDNAGMIDSALPLAERIVDLRKDALGPNSTKTLHARQQYFRLLSDSGDFEAAGVQLDEILARMDADDPGQLDLRHDAWDSLANLLVNTGENGQALETALENLERAERELGRHHANTVRALNTIGYVHALSGDFEPALEFFRESADRARENFEPSDEPYYSARLNVGAALGALGRYEEALETEREVSEILSAKYGRRNASTLRVLNNMALTLTDLERFDAAASLLREILELGRETWGVNSPVTLGIQQSLAGVYMRTEQADRALPLYQSTAEWRERMLGADHPETLDALHDGARAHLELDQHQRARTLARRAYDIGLENDDPGVLSSIELLADISSQTGSRADEIRWRVRLLERLEADNKDFTAPENVASNIRLLELMLSRSPATEAEELAAVIEAQLQQGDEALDPARARYRRLVGQDH
ncbi:MAG: serine/threonine protein kinase [Wenzhouxiangellaceae bacterium]|nr:serine/threonine protein kinase [Wenzhouxiangellaceae bacterium]